MRKTTIDVEGRFIDNISGEVKDAAQSFDKLEKEAKSAQKEVDNLSKKKVKPTVDADTSKLDNKLRKSESMLNKLKRWTGNATLNIKDNATAKIDKITRRLKAWRLNNNEALLKIRDSEALASLRKVSGWGDKIAGKTWTAIVKIKDVFTSPLTKLKNMLFNIKTLIAGIAAAWAATQFTNKFISQPIALADAYSSAQIGFSTLLGESRGQQMMDDLDEFAKATPFKSSEVISQTQRMLAMGWNAEEIITDMETIGDAAAATGKGEQGLQQIVTALAQIKTKGKLSTEELNQLAEAGISAKRYIAEGLGYGSGDSGIAKMTKDLENGKIASDKALQALLGGMMEYKGMMDKTANETVEGLWSQIQDTFEINIFRRWGQGLQDGAKRGFGSVVELLNEADGALEKFGDTIYEVGKNISNWVADKFENAIGRILEITDSFDFKEASLGEKIKMLWSGVVVDPLKEWWEGGGQEKTAETAGEIGAWMGEAITKGLLALFGVTDVFADSNFGENGGMSVAQSFVKGFKDNFDGSAITDAFVDAISDVWGALPTWAKIMLGAYGASKLGGIVGGISSLAGGVINTVGTAKNLVGGFSIASSVLPHLTSSGSGILGLMGKAGVGLGASTTGAALLTGAAGIAGGAAGLASVGKGAYDLYGAYKAHKSGDKIERDAKIASGGTTLSGVGLGAAIGTAIAPGIGTLIGAGIGGISGWFLGKGAADKIRETDDAVNDVTAAVEELESEEEKLAKKNEMVWNNMKDHLGNIKLSASEIERLVDQIVWGDDLGSFESFVSATNQAEASLNSLKTASESMDKWMWKAGLGVKFNDDEIESIKESADEYINSAKAYLENKHYEFTASAELILDLESDEGKSILEAGNAFYKVEQEKLEKAGKELGDALTSALEDGIISADEEKVIIAAQQKIADITNKIAQAQADAEIELIKVKWGNGNLDLDSFETFMASMKSNLEERMTATDEAFEIQVANLKLRYPNGGKEYEKELQTLIDGYKLQVDNIKADVLGVELNMIADAYSKEGVTTDKLATALEKSLAEGIDPIDWTTEQARKFLGIDKLSESSAGAIAQMLGGVADQLELVEVDGELLLKLGIKTEGDTGEKVKNEVEKGVPDTVEETVGVNISGEKEIQNAIDVVQEDFGVPKEHAATVAMLLYGDKDILNQIDVSKLAEEFGIPESQAKTIIEKLKGEKSIENKINVLASDFGIPDVIHKTVQVKVHGSMTTTGIKMDYSSKAAQLYNQEQGYRGGIFGGDSAMDAFARGGRPDDGMLKGSVRYIRVNEESPEMIIPLSSQRRERGLKLWEKTGELLNVPGFARGGNTNGGSEGFRIKQYEAEEGNGGQTVHIEVGGIHLDIHVDATGHQSITEAIQEQAPEIAESIAGILAEALSEQFSNTPTRGGAA